LSALCAPASVTRASVCAVIPLSASRAGYTGTTLRRRRLGLPVRPAGSQPPASSAASRLFLFGQDLVPGLFQTADYARTVIKADHPEENDEEAGQRVSLRMARQALVRRTIDPPGLQVALNESVLRRPVGGAQVMAAQLRRLAQASELPNVSLRVVPFTAGFHPGILSGAFNILRFPLNGGGQESEPPTVYADLYTGALYLDKPNEIDRYSEAFAGIWQSALDEPASRELIQQAAEELIHG